MSGARHLRDARYLDKFMYTLSDALFYEPFEARYEPSREYLDLVADLMRDAAKEWATTRDGFWFQLHPRDFTLPTQGWKVHVSATVSNSSSILTRAAKIALVNDVPFKFALDRKVLSIIGSKRWHRGSSGKFITLYPSDLSCFKSLLEQLYEELRHDEGPYILSDRRYRDCRVLYYRFGGIERTTELDIMGRKNPVLISPGGETIPDVRTPYFALPPWVIDPFPGQETGDEEISLNGGKYLIKRAIAFSNSGGVYLAETRDTGSKVVLKEARAHTAVDDRGYDAIKRLEKERDILELLRDTGVTPRPVESFYDWENFFLVEEYVEGVDVREIMLTQSPLLRVRPSLSDSTKYYEVFREVFTNFAAAVDRVHGCGVVLGDLSASNIKIDPSTHAVRLIDFEGAFRLGVDEPAFLYTPGFKNPATVRSRTHDFADDLYGLAAVALYMLFPVAALSSLREDLYDTVLKVILADVGWSETELFVVISGLAKGELTCTRACELLEKPARVLPPHYHDDIEPGLCERISRELGHFLLANIRTGSKDSLFAGDPFMHQTNSLSLGFGACGVLYSLAKCGFEIPKGANDWLERQLDRADPGGMPPGLLTGASGIAWTLAELGLEERAAEFIDMANQSPLLKRHHSYFYGMAGVGMVNLYLYRRTGRSYYLRAASDLADCLLEVAREGDKGVYWEGEKLVHLGYGYGQSGVALFLLRLSQVTGKEKFHSVGRRALEFDLGHGIETESNVLSFPGVPSDSTLVPYIEEGSAGIAKVAMRYGIWDPMDAALTDLHRKYAGFAGQLYGLAGFIDVLTDAFLYSNDAKFLEMAKRPVSGIRDVQLLNQSNGSATPGDGLFRVSCDYATGVAGVLRSLYRFTHLDSADFTLDEVNSAAPQGEGDHHSGTAPNQNFSSFTV